MTLVSHEEEDDNRWSLNEEMSKVFRAALRLYVPDLPDEEPDIVKCEKKEFGDYYCNNHITIREQRIRDQRKNSSTRFQMIHVISKGIKSNISRRDMSDMMEVCDVYGIGYLCFKLSRTWIAKSIDKMLNNGIDTWAPKLPMKKAVVDFSSRNIAEKMNVGHLRSTIIGDTLVRMLEYCRVKVIPRNRLGDRGTQLGMFIDLLSELFPNGEVNDLSIEELEEFYKESKKRFDEDNEFKMRAQRVAVGLHVGDERYRNVYAQICEINRKDYEKVYKRLGVHVEEKSKSIYDPSILQILVILRKVEGLIEQRGDQVILVEEKKMMHHAVFERKTIPLTVLKEDGSYNYALTDLADLWYEIYEEKAEWIVYVADVRKEQYIELCFAVARRAGWLPSDEKKTPRTKIVGYGNVLGDDIKDFLTPSIQVVDILDEAKTRCEAAVVEHDFNEWNARGYEGIAELGYGAVKYAELKKPRFLNFTVNFDEMLNDKENTSVYLIYTHARLCSIIRKSGEDIEKLKKVGELILENDEEREFGLHLLQFTEAVEDSCTNVVPYILCEYLYKLSERWTNFHCSFHSKCRVEETSRLLLYQATAVVMEKGFHLLGITPLY